MTLQELRYLVALEGERHFGRAARLCFVTQPTLSAGIKKLEEELGVTLVERSRRRVMLSPLGREVAAGARAVLEAAARIEDLARERHEPLVGPFRVGLIPTVGPYLLPRIVARLRAAFPRLRLLIHERKTEELLESLDAGRLDLGILSPPLPEARVESLPLYDEPFLLAVPRDHALAGRRRVGQDDLAGMPMLLLDEGHCLRDQALELCRRAGPLREEFRGASLETLRNMVAAGVGCTLLPALAARPTPAGMRPIPFRPPAPGRSIALAWRRGYARERSARRLGEFLRSQPLPRVRTAG